MKINVCIISCAFIGASLYTSLTCDKCESSTDYREILGPAQKKIYDEIVTERKNIYIQGLVLGLLLASIFIMYNYNTVDPFKYGCIFSAIVLSVQYFYYTLKKKKRYMLSYLTNKEQIDGWLSVYKMMKTRYHTGMLLGIIGFLLLSYSIVKK